MTDPTRGGGPGEPPPISGTGEQRDEPGRTSREALPAPGDGPRVASGVPLDGRHDLQQSAQPAERGSVTGQRGVPLLALGGPVAVDDLQGEGLLGVEVVVDEAVGDPCLVGDIGDAARVEALPGEHPDCGVEDLAASVHGRRISTRGITSPRKRESSWPRSARHLTYSGCSKIAPRSRR